LTVENIREREMEVAARAMSAKQRVLTAHKCAILDRWRCLGHAGSIVYGVWCDGEWLSSYELTAARAWSAAARNLTSREPAE
jgi:hypothetical protein